MKLKKLLVFGDSWPNGQELENPTRDSFPVLLADLVEFESIENFSKPSTSVDQAVYEFINAINNLDTATYDYTILFCLTGSDRSMYMSGKNTMEIHPYNTDAISKAYYLYIHSDELAKFNLIRNILLVQEMCNNRNIPVYFVSNWNSVPEHDLITACIFDKTLVGILGMVNFDDPVVSDGPFAQLKQSNYVLPNDCHPNPAGHKKIAEELANWINNGN